MEDIGRTIWWAGASIAVVTVFLLAANRNLMGYFHTCVSANIMFTRNVADCQTKQLFKFYYYDQKKKI